ncbi:MAG TPA: tRNA (adenosine(37)-N6)-threonylcarbamoyltransferase complex dimerization subunit type 1 TsaB [Candidatus Limnocylindrales bacterium]|nr:tRNA (adenosine(37)-N6)-threonylcarbamoyltransferase complex dimerization subunit type 1 TsaB [Candidatus Limnocylindrales bacterium]
MMILAIRTDKPEAELGIYVDNSELAYVKWLAHRQLAETIHLQTEGLLSSAGKKLQDISGIIVFSGPGSFTGLRIGISMANALAYALGVPIVGSTDKNWVKAGHKLLNFTGQQKSGYVMPHYGAPAHLTLPRK